MRLCRRRESLVQGAKRRHLCPLSLCRQRPPRRFGAIPASPGVIAGDRRAREALEQTEPNTDVAREGFLAGGNAPSDVDNLIWLFVEFRDDEDISHVARLWREGDRLMDELNLIAIRLQEAAASRTLDLDKQRALRQNIQRINEQITPLTKAFRVRSAIWHGGRKPAAADQCAGSCHLVGLALWRANRLLSQSEGYASALRQSEERFKLAVQGSNDGIWDWDMRTGAVYFSPRYKELLGFGQDDSSLDFATLTARLHPEDRERAIEALRRHLANEAHYDVEYRMRTRTGEYRWYRARGRCCALRMVCLCACLAH